MVTITTFGGSRKERMAFRVSLALSKGICTCMMTTSGESSRASLRASASFACEALPEHGVVVGKQHPDQPVRGRVRVSVLSQHPPAPFVLPESHCTVYTIRTPDLRLFDIVRDIPTTVRPASSSGIHRSAWKGDSPKFALPAFRELRPNGVLRSYHARIGKG